MNIDVCICILLVDFIIRPYGPISQSKCRLGLHIIRNGNLAVKLAIYVKYYDGDVSTRFNDDWSLIDCVIMFA